MLELKTYKNYKEICEALEVKPTNGSGKKRHLKLLDSLCKYHKEGNKFIIEEIYEQPREIKDKRKERCSELSERIQFSILYLLSHAENNNLIISKADLLIDTGLINEQFYLINHYKDIYCENRNIDKDVVIETFGKAYSCVSGYLDRAIKMLENKALVSCNQVIFVNMTKTYSVLDDVTDSVVGSKRVKENRMATPKERKFILDCEEKVLKKYGLTSKGQLTFYKIPKFKEDVLKLLGSKEIHSYYRGYDIVGNSRYISEEYENLQEQMNKYLDETNKQIQDKVITSVENRRERIINAKNEITNALNLPEEVVFDFYNKVVMEELCSKAKAKEGIISMYLEDGFMESVDKIVNDGINREIKRIDWFHEMKVRKENRETSFTPEELEEIFSE